MTHRLAARERRKLSPHLPAPSATAKDNAALAQVVGSQFHGYGVTGQDADVMLAHLAGDVGRHHMAISQFHPESRVGQGLDDLAVHLDRVLFGHTALCFTGRGLEHEAHRTNNSTRSAGDRGQPLASPAAFNVAADAAPGSPRSAVPVT